MVLEQADKSDMAEGTEATVEADQEPPTISVTEDTPASSEPDVEITTEEPEVEEELSKADEDKPQDFEPESEDLSKEKEAAAEADVEKLEDAEVVAGDDEATHNLLGDGDVESAKKNGGENIGSEEEKTSLKTRLVRQLSRREVLICLLGGVMFLAGLILILVAVISMQSGCTYIEPDETDLGTEGKYGGGDDNTEPATGGTDFDDVIKYYNDTNSNNTNVVVPEVNLALGRPAFLSTTAFVDVNTPNAHQAELAVDGQYSSSMEGTECAQTVREDKPHFEIDLGDEHSIRQVVLQSSSCCGGELHNFVVSVRQEPDSDDVTCREYLGTALPYTVTLNCTQPIKGRYVRVTIIGDEARPKNRLTLCEVKVYGD